jgi:4-hydroxybutyrate CoA-transferase
VNRHMEAYRQKRVSPGEAVAAVVSGDDVWLPVGAAEPQLLPRALVERRQELSGVSIHQLLPLRPVWIKEDYAPHLRHYSWFCSGASRSAIQEGWGEFIPNYFHEIPRLLTEYRKVNVVMTTVSPMDRHGYFSLGVSVDYIRAAIACADRVLVEVNPHCPRTLGNSFIHISQITHLVEHDAPLPELTIPPVTGVEETIGSFVAERVEDGSTLQLGVGGIPNAVARALTGKKDLGIHTEMITDGMVDLVECGAVTNRLKSLNPGKITGTFAMGTKKLYTFLDDNPLIEMHPVNYTNDPRIIGKNKRMVSINASLEIDLTGQVCSESIGSRQWSGTGGQADFFRGCNISEGGQGFVTLSSTARNGSISRIVPRLTPGAVVTTSRNDVDHVVTEYGIAKLRGKTVRERAQALISIAHPAFRDELEKAALELRYL